MTDVYLDQERNALVDLGSEMFGVADRLAAFAVKLAAKLGSELGARSLIELARSPDDPNVPLARRCGAIAQALTERAQRLWHLAIQDEHPGAARELAEGREALKTAHTLDADATNLLGT